MPSGIVLSQVSLPPARVSLRIFSTDTRLNAFYGPVSDPFRLKKAVHQSLRELNNEGYPFASFRFDSLNPGVKDAELSGHLDAGPKVLNGTIQNHGDSSLSLDLISRWTGFRKDDEFSISGVERIPARLKTLPFAASFREPELEWFGNQAILHVYLRKNPAGSFNGIIGLLPGQGSGQSLLLTGNAEAVFSNLFNRGIGFQLRWSRFAAASQQAFLALDWPYISRQGLGFSGNFDLFRQDSLYFSRRAGAELLFAPTGIWSFRLGFQSMEASQGLGLGLKSINQQVQSMVLGIDMETEAANRISPARKWLWLRILPGIKNLQTQSVNEKFSQLEIRARFQTSLWQNRRSFWLRLNGDAGIIRSPVLLLADQFRLGGLRSFRGFNENQFFSGAHLLIGLQPTWMLASGFLFSVFSEGLLYQPERFWSGLSGFRPASGFGIAAEFEAGKNLIQISLANGWMKGLPFELRSSKIHFGYLALF